MKKLSILFLSLTISSVYAQVAIGKETITNSSVSLEFGSGNRGMILPWVSSASAVTGAVDGTLIFDTTDKKVKYRKNGVWFDLSVDTTGTVDTTLQNALTDLVPAQTTIGSRTVPNTVPGILVLTDNDKAMILPKVGSPHLNIVNPAPGMIVYDTENRQVAVFNGKVWSFWKP